MKRKQNLEPGREARVILSVNLERLMRDHLGLTTQAKVGKVAKIAPRRVGYMLQPDKGNPTLDNIAKVASVFELEAWQLLHPELPARAMGQKEAALYEAIRAAFEASHAKKK